MGFVERVQQVSRPAYTHLPYDVRSERKTGFMRRGCRSWLTLLLSCCVLWAFIRSGIGSYRFRGAARSEDISNRTLGFERIFVVSIPERTDKRDSLLLASSYAEFDFDWHDGVPFDTISSKAAPVNWNYKDRSNGSLGCWRAHMNVLHTIVHQKIQSALIIEDDSDFDISIKQQLAQFASGTRSLQNSTGSLHSPYGDAWDFLWLGHCKLGPGEEQSRMYVIENDSSVAPLDHRNGKWYSEKVPQQVLQEDTRIVFKATHGGTCTYAYAVTYESARKLLTGVSVIPRNDAVDMSYRHMCSGRFGIPFNCYGPYPTLFATHRAAGPQDRDSDLNKKGIKWHAEYTWDIVYSTIQNLPGLVTGSPYVEAQWPEDVKKEKKMVKERLTGVGHVEHIDLRALPKQEIKGINR